MIKYRNENGRPKLGESVKKKYKITVKFATVDYYNLKSKAKSAGVSISEFIRSALQNRVVKERLTTTHLQLILQLTGMANNLNQLAKKANSLGFLESRNENVDLAKRIDSVIKSIEDDC